MATKVNLTDYNFTANNVTVTNTVTAYVVNTTSDERLKENIAKADDSSSIVNKIIVRKFDWKQSGEHQPYGLVAQELNEAYPFAVSTDKEHWTIDYTRLVPVLLQEIKHIKQQLNLLQQKVED
jgi:hypothetical protein